MKKLILIAMIAITPLMGHKSADKKEYKENPFIKKDNFPGGYALSPYSMPPLIGIYMMQEGQKVLKTTPKEHEYFKKRFDVMFKSFHKIAAQIRDLETKMMQKVVYEGADEIDVDHILKEITEKRTKLTIMQISCANSFKNTLSKEKYEQILKMAKEAAKKNKNK